MSQRHLSILQINDLHGYLEPHPEVFRGRGQFNYRTCGGLARMIGVETWIARLAVTLLTFFWGTGLVIYILLWVFVPLEGTDPS